MFRSRLLRFVSGKLLCSEYSNTCPQVNNCITITTIVSNTCAGNTIVLTITVITSAKEGYKHCQKVNISYSSDDDITKHIWTASFRTIAHYSRSLHVSEGFRPRAVSVNSGALDLATARNEAVQNCIMYHNSLPLEIRLH